MSATCRTIRFSNVEQSQFHHDTPWEAPSTYPRGSTSVASLDTVDSDMGPLMTHSADHPSATDQSTGEGSDLDFRPPTMEEGAAIWRIARDSGTLDLNTSYAYLILARDFGATSRLAIADGEPVGFVLGYQRPTAPERLFIWQIAVDASQRGRRIAGRLLDALVADLPQVSTLETTITEDNSASQRLFASFAERHGAEHAVGPLLTEAHFPDPGHGAELLHEITGLRSITDPRSGT